MTRSAILLNGLLMLTVGCSRQNLNLSKSDRAIEPQKVQHATATSEFPGFRVDVALSEEAEKKLIESKETIVVVGYFTGRPKQGATLEQYKQYVSLPGPLGLGEAEVEVAPRETARFGEIKLDQGALAQTNDEGPQLLINVVSGRKSSENNLLECEIYEGSLKTIQGGNIPIKCDLIEEAFPLSRPKPTGMPLAH